MTGLSRNFLIGSSASILFLVLVITLSPIVSPLPPYTGQYEVGILDLETETERRTIHDAVLKETGEKAFELQTLAISLYYPSALPPMPEQPWARPWLPQPVSLIGTGYARLIGIRFAPLQWVVTGFLWAFGSGTVIPGVVDAPVLSAGFPGVEDLGKVVTKLGVGGKVKGEQSAGEVLELRDLKVGDGPKLGKKMGKLPLVVFTHGMAGMSQSYAHYLGSIASHGYVVAAVEHRDGSGPGTVVHYPDGKERYVWHLKLDDLM
jgi:platelet-activating factor acetylhydrolase